MAEAIIYFLLFVFLKTLIAPSGPGPPHCRGFEITLRHTTLGRTPLFAWSTGIRDLYLTTHNTHKRQTSMPPAGFKPAIPRSGRQNSHVLDPVVTGIGDHLYYCHIKSAETLINDGLLFANLQHFVTDNQLQSSFIIIQVSWHIVSSNAEGLQTQNSMFMWQRTAFSWPYMSVFTRWMLVTCRRLTIQLHVYCTQYWSWHVSKIFLNQFLI